MRKTFILAILTTSLIIYSCKKEDSTTGNDTNPLKGSWKFLGMTAHTNATTSANYGGMYMSTVATSDYTSIQASGTVIFSDSIASSQGIGYSVTTNVLVASYEAGQLVDTTSQPVSFTAPPTSSASQYKIIGSDSVYFSAGALTAGTMPGGSATPVSAAGYKFHITGDTLLTLSASFAKDSILNTGGVSATLRQQATFTTTLRRQ
jgi:hypothetical protein